MNKNYLIQIVISCSYYYIVFYIYIYIYINIYSSIYHKLINILKDNFILKTICPSGYHHNGFVLIYHAGIYVIYYSLFRYISNNIYMNFFNFKFHLSQSSVNMKIFYLNVYTKRRCTKYKLLMTSSDIPT